MECGDLWTLLAYGMWTDALQPKAETKLFDVFKKRSVWGKEVKTCHGEGCVLFALCPVECRYDDKPSIMRLVLVMTTQVLPQYHSRPLPLPLSPAVPALWTQQQPGQWLGYGMGGTKFRPREVKLIFLLSKPCGLSLESTQPPIKGADSSVRGREMASAWNLPPTPIWCLHGEDKDTFPLPKSTTVPSENLSDGFPVTYRRQYRGRFVLV